MSIYENQNKVHRLVVCVSPSMKRRVKRKAEEYGVSASQLVRMSIDCFIEESENAGDASGRNEETRDAV